ncbi:STAS domain-containing protein [Sphingobium boeckii]|uniref:Anti-anti-sigma regulatory factor n=1 Tax=Sphingobium boeckii TaxID=1082345 RepID=A0A7W9AGX1_9SPHN|nr:STAS domain-containing protein [Sphingobium boeckii]MBB5685239.1 anti-anti-sigma regulatory factor [Sphingobium boeckii]
MPKPYDQAEDRALRLPSHGTTVTAEDLRVRLVLCSDFDGEMLIDGSQVESVGQAVLQLLVAARQEAITHDQPFAITNPSSAFVERAKACMLSAALGLDIQGESVQ